MDFKNVPNTSSYPVVEPTDPAGGISSGSIDPNAFTGATLQDSDEKPKSNTKLIYAGILILFALMTAGSIAFFFYLNSQNAAASERENKYQPVAAVQPTARPTITIAPTPTLLLLSITPSPLPTAIPVTIFATPTPQKGSQTDAQNQQQTTGTRARWEIAFEKTSYSRTDTNGVINPSFTGTLHTPLVRGKTVCTASHQTFFTEKRDEKTIARLCDDAIPTPVAYSLTCSSYDPDAGIQVSAQLYPKKNCSSGAEPPESGTYVMAVKVYYDCNVSAGATIAAPSDCTSSRDVFSYDLYYQN